MRKLTSATKGGDRDDARPNTDEPAERKQGLVPGFHPRPQHEQSIDCKRERRAAPCERGALGLQPGVRLVHQVKTSRAAVISDSTTIAAESTRISHDVGRGRACRIATSMPRQRR